jgi:hypothetical protein
MAARLATSHIAQSRRPNHAYSCIDGEEGNSSGRPRAAWCCATLCESLSVFAALSHQQAPESHERGEVSILWIILVVAVVLALLGYFGRGRGRRRAL